MGNPLQGKRLARIPQGMRAFLRGPQAGQAVHYRNVMCAQSRCQACISILQTYPKQGVFASLRAKSRSGVPPPQHILKREPSMRRQDIQLLTLARQGDPAARSKAGRRYLVGGRWLSAPCGHGA